MNTIYKDLLVYANDCDYKYPTANKWCDLLLAHPTHSFVVPASFQCPAHKNHRGSYAMNPNCEPNSPPDMVLLFETKDDWNQFGGPELLTFDNHGGKGCNILFNDGHIEFIKPSQVSRLKWSVVVGLSEAILEDTLRTVLYSDLPDPKELSSFRETLRGKLAEDAKATKAKLSVAQKTWQSSGMTPQDYMQAALVIIKNMEQNEHKWLTIGNAMKALGPPSLVVHNEYTFVESDNIDPEITRMNIYYENRKVSVSFSTAGFVGAVLHKKTPEQWSGSGLPMHWPQKHTYAQRLPIISKTFDTPDKVTSLVRAAEGLIKKNPTEGHWLQLMLGPESARVTDSAYDKSSCSARIILIDGLAEGLAKVHFQTSGLHTLYCDTWWLHKEGEWEIIPHRQAENILMSHGQAG